MFTPEEVPLFGSNSAFDWANFHVQAFSDESLSFDEVGTLKLVSLMIHLVEALIKFFDGAMILVTVPYHYENYCYFLYLLSCLLHCRSVQEPLQ